MYSVVIFLSVLCLCLANNSSSIWNFTFVCHLNAALKVKNKCCQLKTHSFYPSSHSSLISSIRMQTQPVKNERCFKGNTGQGVSSQGKGFKGNFQLITSSFRDNQYFFFKNVFSVAHWKRLFLFIGEMRSLCLPGQHFRPVQWSPSLGWLGSGWFLGPGRMG